MENTNAGSLLAFRSLLLVDAYIQVQKTQRNLERRLV